MGIKGFRKNRNEYSYQFDSEAPLNTGAAEPVSNKVRNFEKLTTLKTTL